MEKFFDRIEPTGFCWLWTGGLNNCGYGQVTYRGKTCSAHRAVYTELVGEIPKGLQLDHLCHIRNCVNPDHLEPITKAENMRRAGIRNGWNKHKKTIGARKPHNVMTKKLCNNGHVLADVGVYSYTLKSGTPVNTCLGCKAESACKHNHVAKGCPKTCKIQRFKREVDIAELDWVLWYS
jgi:HNH endonuclease